MKIEMQQEDLAQALSLVASVVPAKTTLPILTCILAEAGEEGLKLSATNLDISVTTTTDKATVKRKGRAAVPAAKLFSFVRSLAPGRVTLEEKGGRILVTAGKAVLEEPGMNVEEFPSLPQPAAAEGLEIEAAALATMIRETSYAVSRDETRPALMGVLWEVRPDVLAMVATDAHRLARSERKVDWAGAPERDLIVDTQGLAQLARLAEGGAKAIVNLGDSQVSFHLGPTVLHTRLLEGPFPDYGAVIPRSNEKRVVIDRDGFSQAIRRVSITADRITSQVRLGIESGRMELSATGTDGSRAEDEIPVGYEGEALQIGFNFTYLQDILKNVGADTVEMALKDPQSAALIKPADDGREGDLLCLLMPLRLTSD